MGPADNSLLGAKLHSRRVLPDVLVVHPRVTASKGFLSLTKPGALVPSLYSFAHYIIKGGFGYLALWGLGIAGSISSLEAARLYHRDYQ